MKIQYASDLHIEFPENREFIKSNPIKPMGDILILAGDIVPFAVLENNRDFFDYLSDNFETTYWVPGNHEYYRFDVLNKPAVMNENIRSNVFLVNNTVSVHENVKFIFSTLWSKIRPSYQWHIERGMSDFRVIRYGGYRFSADRFNQMHDESIKFLERELSKETEAKTVVVTHHVPTFLNYPEKYKNDILNDAFAVELFNLIESKGPDYWIYGHNHFNQPGFNIGTTKLLTNQLGYVSYGEHTLFSNEKHLEL